MEDRFPRICRFTDETDNIPIPGSMLRKAKIRILDDVRGVIKPGRLTLLLGPPGCGKMSFLKALSGTLNKSLKKTAAYISQEDLQIPEMTVRETLDFSACCLGVVSRADMMMEVSRREEEAGIFPDPHIDSYMKITVEIAYTFLQAFLFVIITYPKTGFYASAYKIFWYLYAMFCIFLSFNYLGLLLVSVMPNIMVAAILASAFYTLLNLFAGFSNPKTGNMFHRFVIDCPKWLIWIYCLCPTSWALNGLLTSQYGDVGRTITVFGAKKSVEEFIREYFGFHHDQLYAIAKVLAAFPFIQALLFAFTVGRFDF